MKHPYLITVVVMLLVSISYGQNVGIGTNSPNAKLDIAGNLALREGTALSLSTGSNDNITLTAPVASLYRITGPGASFSITGIAGGQNGQVVTLVNTTSYDLTLVNDATSTAANRLYVAGGASRTISGSNSIVTLQYNTSLSRWIVTDITSAKDGINWSLTGNSGTTAGTNFIGTTDAQDLVIKTGGSATSNERIRATSSGDVVINEQGNSNDLRVETDNDANALVIKGSSDNIGIGGAPDSKAKLDIAASDKGILIPRVALTSSTAPIANPKPSGLMVYNTSTSGSYPTPGLYLWDGTDWQRVILNSTLSGSLQPLSSTSGGGLQFTPGSYNGGTSTTVGIATDGINNGMLQDNIITTNEILNGTVGTSDLATPAVNASNQIFNTLPVSNGGTGQSSLSANGVLIGNGTSAVSVSGAPSPGQVLVGNASNVPTFTSLGGDVSSVSATGNLQLTATGVTASTYGSSTKAPIITVDAKGRLTSASDVTISGTVPGGAAGGDLSGTYPNPTVAQIQGRPVSSAVPSANDVLAWNGSSWVPSNKAVPSGVIVMWSGTQAAIPSGWVLCDGGSGTPDLRDRFVLSVTGSGGSYDVGATGGAHTKTIAIANLPAHNHTGTTDATTPTGSFTGTAATITPSASFSGTSVSTSTVNTDHTHNWGGWWSNDNATDVGTGSGNGDGTQNTYSDGSLGIYTWGTNGTATTTTSNGAHSHSLTLRNYQWNGSSGDSWWTSGNGGYHGVNTSVDGAHTHTVSIPAHRHYIKQRATSGMSANATHSHTVTAAGTVSITGASYTPAGSVAVGSHTHTFTTANTGSGTALDIRPAFYRLAYIMKQ